MYESTLPCKTRFTVISAIGTRSECKMQRSVTFWNSIFLKKRPSQLERVNKNALRRKEHDMTWIFVFNYKRSTQQMHDSISNVSKRAKRRKIRCLKKKDIHEYSSLYKRATRRVRKKTWRVYSFFCKRAALKCAKAGRWSKNAFRLRKKNTTLKYFLFYYCCNLLIVSLNSQTVFIQFKLQWLSNCVF